MSRAARRRIRKFFVNGATRPMQTHAAKRAGEKISDRRTARVLKSILLLPKTLDKGREQDYNTSKPT
jgi:hypothetical protein